jgi:UDP-3-O-[3-hydroxymyristoyl] glucosamine N-acyltransferase
MKLAEIAAALNARVEGDGQFDVVRAVHPAEAQGPGDLALAMESGLLARLADSPARAAVVAEGAEVPPALQERLKGWIVIKRPRYAMAGLLDLFALPVHFEPGVHPTAWIAPDATIGQDVAIGPFVTIGPRAVVGDGCVILSHVSIGADARIGRGGLFHPGARIGERVVVGERCIVHPNAVVGADGFSFVTPEPGSVESAKATGRVEGTNTLIRRVNSIGTVILGDDVEVGANTCIDRATVTATRIGNGTKLDNLVQIGHNVTIGSNCLLCGQVGIAGSAEIGDRVVLAGKVGVADHVKIGHDAVVAGNSGVGSNIPPRSIYFGTPAVPRAQAFEQYKGLSRLKRLFADVAELKARLKASGS